MPSRSAEDLLLGSRFLTLGGVIVLEGLFDQEALGSMRREAAELSSSATRSESAGSGDEDWRGGDPARAYWAVSGGQAQFSLLSGPDASAALSDACGLPIQMTGGGSYSYYADPGDFLALHRDILRCDLALLTCLEDTSPTAHGGGALQVYPAYATEPLSRLRGEPHPARVELPLRPGQSALLLGGIVPHEVTPMAGGQRRTMSVVCFRLVGG